jgi:hypothetical protein
MRVLVACEMSGIVRDAFLARGHDAWSCDLMPSVHPGDPRHIQGDVLNHLNADWDLLIAHPPCTYLTNAGVRWLHEGNEVNEEPSESRWDRMRKGAAFFLKMLNAPIAHVAVENPIIHKYAKEIIGPQTQVIQPWMFGDQESKAICLWLRGLPDLVPTHTKPAAAAVQNVHNQSPGPARSILRSMFFPGVARAMADQWGRLNADPR